MTVALKAYVDRLPHNKFERFRDFAMTKFLIALIEFYRRWLSPLKPPCCRFVPTCSSYAVEALRKYGWARGSLLALWRIMRCNPFCKGGFDPVP